MKARVNPPCGIVELTREVEKLKQEKPKRIRKPRPEWSRRGVR